MSEIVNENPVNEATGKELRTRSNFNLNYVFYNTQRFGEYTPHFWMEGVNNDRLPLQSSHTIRSYTLSAPLMSDLKINKDYFFVPMQAILPNNWNKFIENPVIGDDVPTDCGPSVQQFWSKIATLASNSKSYLDSFSSHTYASGTYDGEHFLDAIFKFLVFFERFYSDGSLMSNLGIHGGRYFYISNSLTNKNREQKTYDEWFDAFIEKIEANTDYFYVTDGTNIKAIELTAGSLPTTIVENKITLRDYLEIVRDDFTWTISVYKGKATTIGSTSFQLITQTYGEITNEYTTPAFIGCASDQYLDLRRLWAYQLICYHYYSNDKVDYIYSAELFRQYIQQLTSRKTSVDIAEIVGSFVVNGLEYQYDALSANTFNRVITNFNSNIFAYTSNAGNYGPDILNDAYAYFRALFGFNRSLRYKDYFTASNTRPLAVGDVNVSVNNSMVDVIDVTKNIQKQRFLNAVNRLPHQIEDYLEGLFGKRPAPDYHNPFFLARTTDDVFGQESEYTGNVTQAEMNNITSVLRSNASRFAFEFNPDRDCVVLGITSYDIPRAYSMTTERQAMHATRFDAFNPYMQFIGDQSVYKSELGVGTAGTLDPFGYQLRHMEYKQRYNQVAGGFRKFLPGWAFIAETKDRYQIDEQSPEFIRSHNTELDDFYKHLTGYSLGSYFHFIVKNVNSMNASRPMAYAPTIL